MKIQDGGLGSDFGSPVWGFGWLSGMGEKREMKVEENWGKGRGMCLR